jgi:hypothetical protein
LAGWVKLDNVTAIHTLLCISDDQSSNFDFLEVAIRGDVANDPVQAAAGANGTGGTGAQLIGCTAGNWLLVGGYYAASNSRYAMLGGSLGTQQTTSRAATGLTTTAAGKRRLGADSFWFAGKLAEVCVAQNFTAGDITTTLTQLAAGTRPVNVSQLSGKIVLYQPLLAGLDESGYVQSLTNSNVTFDSTDHPIAYFKSAWARNNNVLI